MASIHPKDLQGQTCGTCAHFMFGSRRWGTCLATSTPPVATNTQSYISGTNCPVYRKRPMEELQVITFDRSNRPSTRK